MSTGTDISRVEVLVWSYLLGMVGADRFYLGQLGLGLLKLLTMGGLGIWYTVDLAILIVEGIAKKKTTRLKDGVSISDESVDSGYKLAWVLLIMSILIVCISTATSRS